MTCMVSVRSSVCMSSHNTSIFESSKSVVYYRCFEIAYNKRANIGNKFRAVVILDSSRVLCVAIRGTAGLDAITVREHEYNFVNNYKHKQVVVVNLYNEQT